MCCLADFPRADYRRANPHLLIPPQSSQLEFATTEPSDLGEYRCKATFTDGSILYSDQGALIVLFVSMETATSASKGDQLTITATLVNDREVRYSFIF